jgi:hypothetical protein
MASQNTNAVPFSPQISKLGYHSADSVTSNRRFS